MELLSQNKIYDPFRKEWVKKTPEEFIRQKLLQKMTDELGFPRSLIAVEKELQKLPRLLGKSATQVPKRRVDVIVFAKNFFPGHDLFPLLLIECKAHSLTPQFAQQVIGYNLFVQAPFIALVNEYEMLTGKYDYGAGLFSFHSGLPNYATLLDCIKKAEINRRDAELRPAGPHQAQQCVP